MGARLTEANAEHGEACSHKNQQHTSCSDCRLHSICLPIALEASDIARLDQIIERSSSLERGQMACEEDQPFTSLYALRTGSLKAYRLTHERGLTLQLVSADDPDDLEAVNAFLRKHHSPVDSLVSTELSGEFIELFSTNWSGVLPASFFIDANGTLVAEWAGMRSYDEYIQTVEQLLKP